MPRPTTLPHIPQFSLPHILVKSDNLRSMVAVPTQAAVQRMSISGVSLEEVLGQRGAV